MPRREDGTWDDLGGTDPEPPPPQPPPQATGPWTGGTFVTTFTPSRPRVLTPAERTAREIARMRAILHTPLEMRPTWESPAPPPTQTPPTERALQIPIPSVPIPEIGDLVTDDLGDSFDPNDDSDEEEDTPEEHDPVWDEIERRARNRPEITVSKNKPSERVQLLQKREEGFQKGSYHAMRNYPKYSRDEIWGTRTPNAAMEKLRDEYMVGYDEGYDAQKKIKAKVTKITPVPLP